MILHHDNDSGWETEFYTFFYGFVHIYAASSF